MIVIVDYNVGNVRSIHNMLGKLGAESVISGDARLVGDATRIILPGVGAFDYGMGQLAERKLVEVLQHKALRQRVPVLGICLGMQLMCRGSEEGELPGLGWFPTGFVRFGSGGAFEERVPHMTNFLERLKVAYIRFAEVDF